jgi:hypothetical protein
MPATKPTTSATTPTCTLPEFAQLIGKTRTYAYDLRKAGRLVMAPDGKRVLIAESLARYDATKDPSKQGVADYHASQRQDPATTPATTPPTSPGVVSNHTPADPPDDEPERYSEYNFQDSKAEREHWAAKRERSLYQKEAGQLMQNTEVVAAFAQAGTDLRQKLERWHSILPPQLAGRDEATIRSALQEQTERILSDVSDHFARAATASP